MATKYGKVRKPNMGRTKEFSDNLLLYNISDYLLDLEKQQQ